LAINRSFATDHPFVRPTNTLPGMPVIRPLSLLLAWAALFLLGACTDAATRVVYDLEAGAKRLQATSAPRFIVDHTPKPEPEGCPGSYTLQLSQASALLVWCQDSIGGPSSASHTTTYHLNYVAVPQTLIIHKGPGQHTLITLTRQGGAIEVTGLR
jgi:hypothetical protein